MDVGQALELRRTTTMRDALVQTATAQRFFNLTAQEVKIDSVLPVFNYAYELGYGFKDSTYSVTIDYPEFITMSHADVERSRAKRSRLRRFLRWRFRISFCNEM